MSRNFILYTSKISPFGHSVELALNEAKADFTRFEIDTSNKPEWFVAQVNPAGKIPAVAYGGSAVRNGQPPSPESIKIAESLVILEFVSDLYPSASLLPNDPVLRAKARFFIHTVSTKFFPQFLAYFLLGNGSLKDLLSAFEDIQALLPPKGFAVGEWSIADAALTPFAARLLQAIELDLGAFPVGEGPVALEALRSPKFDRFNQYWREVTSRPSFLTTFDEEYMSLANKAKFGGEGRGGIA